MIWTRNQKGNEGSRLYFLTEKNTTQFSLGNFKASALNLDRIIKSKKAANRKKDRLSIPVLEDALKLISAAGKKQF